MKTFLISIAVVAFLLSQHTGKAAVTFGEIPGIKNETGKAVTRKSIPIKSTRDFMKRYNELEKESWSAIRDGYVARFTEQDISYAAYYNSRGNYLCTVKNYSEKKLPEDIRVPIRMSYYDYSIIHVTEVLNNRTNVYFVQVKNMEGNYKILRSINGEIEVHQEYKNSPAAN